MDTATCVRGMETWCPPENTKLRASHILPVLANIFCIKITEFVRQQNADILSCNYRLIMTQHNADKWMDCIWRLINSTHRAGSGGDPLPSLRRWTQLCVSQTLIIHVPLTPDKLFRAYSKSYTPCQRFFLKKEKKWKIDRVPSWTLNTFLFVWYPKHRVKALKTHDSIFTWKNPIFAIYCCDGLSFTKEEQLVHIWNTLTLKISLNLFPFSKKVCCNFPPLAIGL